MLLKPIQVAAPIWATKHYLWATRFQFLWSIVTTKALKSICSTGYYCEVVLLDIVVQIPILLLPCAFS